MCSIYFILLWVLSLYHICILITNTISRWHLYWTCSIITCKHYFPETNILFQLLHEKFKSIYLDINSNLNKIRIQNLEICMITYFNIKTNTRKVISIIHKLVQIGSNIPHLFLLFKSLSIYAGHINAMPTCTLIEKLIQICFLWSKENLNLSHISDVANTCLYI